MHLLESAYFLIEYLLENYQVFVLWSFAGAMIEYCSSLLKESTRESDRDKIDLAWFWATFHHSGLVSMP